MISQLKPNYMHNLNLYLKTFSNFIFSITVINIMISQLRPNYMHILNLYLKTIEQRNKYLRQIKEEHKDENLLEIWDEKLAEYAVKIYEYRKEFIEKIIKKINIIHKNITNGEEQIKLEYITECDNKEKYLQLLKERRKLDIIKGFTTKGIHRDDFVIYINKKEIKISSNMETTRQNKISRLIQIEPQCFL